MPRRNSSGRRRPQPKGESGPQYSKPARIANTDLIALELVRTGKASAAILGSHIPTPRTTNERRNA